MLLESDLNRFISHLPGRCAIVGANGYLGTQMKNLLSRLGVKLDLYDIQDDSSAREDGLCYQKLDITDDMSWKNFNVDVDVIYYFAGLTGTSAGFKNPLQYIQVNECGLIRLCESVLSSPVASRPRIIFPSTRLVYKGAEIPLVETAEKQTKTLYAVNKLACEGLLYAYRNAYGLDYVIPRICVPYGNIEDNQHSYGTLGFFLKQFNEKRTVKLYGNGAQRRTFTHVLDLCYVLMRLAKASGISGEIYNIGGEDKSLCSLAEQISAYGTGSVSFVPWPDLELKLESGSTVFDDSKLLKLIPNYLTRNLSDEIGLLLQMG